jgi:Ca2+-binding RTX toxin-like protein
MADFIEVTRSELQTAPYSRVGAVIVTFPNSKQYSGTFSLVGRNDILTATHIVFSPEDGGLATKLEFYLGADYNKITGSFETRGYEFTVIPNQNNVKYFNLANQDSDNTTLTSKESQYDVALVGTNFEVGDIYGWLKINPFYTPGTSLLSSIGYPANTSGMMVKALSIRSNSYNDIFINNENDAIRPGNSGGPLLDNNYVVGVASAGSSGYAVWADLSLTFSSLVDAMIANDSLLPAGPAENLVFDFSWVSNTFILGSNADEIFIQKSNDINLYKVINGLGGNDTITGGNGYDRLLGGNGDDKIYGNGGIDNIDGEPGDDELYGGEGNDNIIGGIGNDIIDGGLGNNTMKGGLGNDIYVYYPKNKDKIVEVAGEGNDTLMVSSSFSLKTTKIANIESLWGISKTGISLTGDKYDNLMWGDSGNDILIGDSGNDTLIGWAGKDTFYGGLGNDALDGGRYNDSNDTFVFNSKLGPTNIDTLYDFVGGLDKLAIDDAIFTKLKNDRDLSDNFTINIATTAKHYLIYNNLTGALFYDADGNGKGAVVQFVTLTGSPSLEFSDFIIV